MIKTNRLYLRKFQENDGEALYDYLSKEKVHKYEPYSAFTLEEAIAEAKKRSESDMYLAVCLKENDKLVGNLYFAPDGPEHLNTYSLGYVFNPKYQRLGYATEACRGVLDYGFKELGLHRVVAYCNCLNERSWKLMERLGMRREATMIENIYFKLDQNNKPLWVNSYQYALLDKEYK